MDVIIFIILMIVRLAIYATIIENIRSLKRECEKKDQQIQHLWTKIGQLEEKIKNTPE